MFDLLLHITNKEAKIIYRSMLFRVFAVMILALILFIHFQEQSVYVNSNWRNMALSAYIPLLNARLFCLLQTIIVILIASDFHIKERKDTLEVLRSYPESNFSYYVGKIGGTLKALLGLAILSIVLAMVFHLFASPSPFRVYPYLFYFFTLTLPTIVGVTGFAFMFATLLKNRALSMTLLFLFALIFYYYLPQAAYGVFDLYALHTDTMLSEVTGHGDLPGYLLQRGLFLFSGIAFILFSVTLQKRINNKTNDTRNYLLMGVVLLCMGILTAFMCYHKHYTSEQTREVYRATYTKYTNIPRVTLQEQDIHYRQEGNRLSVQTQLIVENENALPIDSFVLYLNPALEIQSVSVGEERCSFRRDHQALVITTTLKAGEKKRVDICYDGKIDERICYLYITRGEREEQISRFDTGRRYAFLEKRHTLLIPECLWYPVSIPPGFYPESLLATPILFHLKVKKTTRQTVLSQGDRVETEGYTEFTHARALPGISLCIGSYKKRSITLEGQAVHLYTLKNNHLIGRYFKGMDKDTIQMAYQHRFRLTSDLVPHSFPQLLLVEVPATFRSYYRNWEGQSEYTQPEFFFWREEALFSQAINYSDNISNKEKMGEIIASFTGVSWTEPIIHAYHLSPLHYNYNYHIHSTAYPILDRVWKSTLYRYKLIDRSDKRAYVDVAAYLSGHSFDQALHDKHISPFLLYSIISAKGEQLCNYILTRITRGELIRFDDYINQKYTFQCICFNDFAEELYQQTGVDLSSFMEPWLHHIGSIPEYHIKGISYGKTELSGERKVRFKIYNNSPVEGIISVMFPFMSPHSTSYTIPPYAYKEVYLPATGSQLEIDFGVAKNIPTTRYHDHPSNIFTPFEEKEDGIYDIDSSAFHQNNTDEIIIDDQDKGFRVIAPGETSWLVKLFKKEDRDRRTHRYPYSKKWNIYYNNYNNGEVIRSVWMRLAGSGKTHAEWTTTIQKEGNYDLYVYKPPFHAIYVDPESKKSPFYYYICNQGTKEEVICFFYNMKDPDWIHLGQFYLKQGETTVMLSDKSDNPQLLIYADAIKWIYLGEK